MKNKIRLTAAAIAAVTALSCAGVTAYADRIKTVDGMVTVVVGMIDPARVDDYIKFGQIGRAHV